MSRGLRISCAMVAASAASLGQAIAGTQGLLRLPALRNVAEHQNDAYQLPAIVHDGSSVHLDGIMFAGTTDQDDVDWTCRQLFPCGERSRPGPCILSCVLLIDKPGYFIEVPASGFHVVSPARKLLGNRVDVSDLSVRIGRDHGVAQAVQRDLEAFAAFGELPALFRFSVQMLFVCRRELAQLAPRQGEEQDPQRVATIRSR